MNQIVRGGDDPQTHKVPSIAVYNSGGSIMRRGLRGLGVAVGVGGVGGGVRVGEGNARAGSEQRGLSA